MAESHEDAIERCAQIWRIWGREMPDMIGAMDLRTGSVANCDFSEGEVFQIIKSENKLNRYDKKRKLSRDNKRPDLFPMDLYKQHHTLYYVEPTDKVPGHSGRLSVMARSPAEAAFHAINNSIILPGNSEVLGWTITVIPDLVVAYGGTARYELKAAELIKGANPAEIKDIFYLKHGLKGDLIRIYEESLTQALGAGLLYFWYLNQNEKNVQYVFAKNSTGDRYQFASYGKKAGKQPLRPFEKNKSDDKKREWLQDLMAS